MKIVRNDYGYAEVLKEYKVGRRRMYTIRNLYGTTDVPTRGWRDTDLDHLPTLDELRQMAYEACSR